MGINRSSSFIISAETNSSKPISWLLRIMPLRQLITLQNNFQNEGNLKRRLLLGRRPKIILIEVDGEVNFPIRIK